MTENNIENNFWKRVNKAHPSQCWEWTGGKTKNYGQLRVGYQRVLAHRLAYELTKGDIPDGLFVCHKCDNPPCCNPDHLFVGTALDNNRDREGKGRGRRSKGKGAPKIEKRQNKSKLSSERRIEIKTLYATGFYSYQQLADRFQVSVSTIFHWV